MPPQRKRHSAARHSSPRQPAREAPPTIRCGGGTAGARYRRIPDHHAVHRLEAKAPSAEAVLVLEGGRVAVLRGAARMPRSGSGDVLGPVYRLVPGGAMAVPTGLVLLRFREGASARESSTAIARAGYEIASVLDYAPSAAWVRAATGSIEDSLRNLAALRELPGVESAEPQMLMASRRR